MEHDRIARFFTRPDGSYFFARWGRPIAPVVFGVDDATLRVVKGAIEALVTLAGHKMTQTDPELGANLMVFFCRDWSELAETPDLGHLIPDFGRLVLQLEREGANQYRYFRFDELGAIRAAFVFVRMDDALAGMPAADLALAQAVQVMLVWSGGAVRESGPLAIAGDKVVLHPVFAALIRAAYDPVMPVAATDASHALRLSARMGQDA